MSQHTTQLPLFQAIDAQSVARFWSKVRVGSADECWEWQAGINSTGRGIFWYDGKSVHSHRFAWIITYGNILDGLQICHRCDNGKCVNPAHLFLGTQYDNIHDMIDKGRDRVLRGSADPKSKLTEEDVRRIRELYIPRKFSQFKLAIIFGVSRSTIENIITGRCWKHV